MADSQVQPIAIETLIRMRDSNPQRLLGLLAKQLIIAKQNNDFHPVWLVGFIDDHTDTFYSRAYNRYGTCYCPSRVFARAHHHPGGSIVVPLTTELVAKCTAMVVQAVADANIDGPEMVRYNNILLVPTLDIYHRLLNLIAGRDTPKETPMVKPLDANGIVAQAREINANIAALTLKRKALLDQLLALTDA